jgi:hypothetical protein
LSRRDVFRRHTPFPIEVVGEGEKVVPIKSWSEKGENRCVGAEFKGWSDGDARM